MGEMRVLLLSASSSADRSDLSLLALRPGEGDSLQETKRGAPGLCAKLGKMAFMQDTSLTQQELKARLLASDPLFRTLADLHAELKREIEEIESRHLIAGTDELTARRLKVLKLRVKDQMNELMAQAKQGDLSNAVKLRERPPSASSETSDERGLYMLSDDQFEAWLADMAQYSDKITPAEGETFSREMIYQNHD
jgi:uncharacterized protein YdcH (DUF465 family)